MPQHCIHIITGAPGSGKSTALAAFLDLKSAYIAFDSDWLVEPASRLAGKDIRVEQATWQPYNVVWFEIVRAIYANHRVPVLFVPLDQRDIERQGQPAWCSGINWLLLDCADDLRRQRLTRRPGWTLAMVEEAIADAQFLRATVAQRIDTGVLAPTSVAEEILRWLERTR